MKLRQRILLTQLPALVVVLVMLVFGGATVKHLGNLGWDVLEENYRSVVALERMKESIERLDSAALFRLSGSTDLAEALVAEHRPAFEAQLQIEEQNLTEPGEGEIAQSVRTEWTAYQALYDRFSAAPPDAARGIYFGELLPAFQAVKDGVDRLLELNEQAMAHKSERASETADVALGAWLVCSALGLAAALGLGTLVSRRLTGPLRATCETAELVGQGQLEVRLPPPGVREMDALAGAFNAMVDNLRAARRAVDERTAQLVAANRQLAQEVGTRQRIAEDLVRTESEYRTLFESAIEGIFRSTPEGRYLDANPAMAALLGYATPEEFIGSVQDIGTQVYADPERRNELIRVLTRDGEIRGFEAELVRRDGSRLWASLNARAIRGANCAVTAYEGFAADISARKRAEQEVRRLAHLHEVVARLGERALRLVAPTDLLQETAALVADTLDVERVGILELLPGGDALVVRAGVGWKEGVVGHAEVEGAGTQPGYTVLSDRPVVMTDAASETRFTPLAQALGEPVVSGLSVVIVTNTGAWGTLGAHSAHPRAFTDDEVSFLQAVANVLGAWLERRRAEASLRRLNRALEALSACNEALVRAEEEPALLRRICQIVVEKAGYLLSWVGYAEDDAERTVRPVAQAGFEEGYLATVDVRWADTQRGRGPTGTCIRTGQTVVCKNVATDPQFEPWRAQALKRGYASSVALPILVESRPIGALMIYATEPDAFHDDEVQLLGELCNDLAFGITTLRKRAEGRQAAEDLRRVQERFSGIFHASPDGIGYVAMDGALVDVNEAFVSLTGYTREELLGGMTWQRLTPPHHLERETPLVERILRTREPAVYEKEYLRKDGQPVPVELTTFVVHGADGAPAGLAAIVKDITARKAAEAQIAHLAYYDALTDLPNRALFRDRLDQALASARRERRMLAIHFLDLDHFKDVNDALGHAVGDALLVAVGERLRGATRAGDTVARLGGDEFAVIQSDLTRVESAAALAGKLVSVVSEPFPMDLHDIRTTASVGVTVFPLDDASGEQLLENADMAMYLAKKEGRNNYRFFTASLNAELRERVTLVADLRQALVRGELELFYQPQVDLRRGALVGMEALIRWRHPARGLLSPTTFIALAEESGLIVPLGTWVIERACAQNHAWHAAGLPRVRVSVNVSALQLRQGDLMATVDAILRSTGLSAEWLEIELTESALLEDVQGGRNLLGALHRAGVHLAVDDFGTGYSSLSYLARLEVDRLKIDRSFVTGLLDDPDSAAITQTIVNLGHCLRMQVIAEGVETQAQRERLREMGCDEGQGFLFDRPLPADVFARVLERASGMVGT